MSLIETVTRSETKSQGNLLTVEISIDGQPITTREGELLVEALMGPIQTCDACLVEVDGKLVRSCGTTAIAHLALPLPTRLQYTSERREHHERI